MPTITAVPKARFDRFIDSVGDGSGTKDMATDHTANDETFTAADTDIITVVAHGLATGDGPFKVSNSGGALPAGLAAATNYWIVDLAGDDTFSLAASYADAIATVPVVVDITDAGTGTHTIHVPTRFKLAPPSGVIMDVARLNISIEDNASPTASGYGGLAALTQGIEFYHKRGGTGNGNLITDMCDGLPVKQHAHWGRWAGTDVGPVEFIANDNVILVRPETTPNDIKGMYAAVGIFTFEGRADITNSQGID